MDDPLLLDRVVAAHFPDADSRDASAMRCVSAGWRASLDWRRRRSARARAAGQGREVPPLALPPCWTIGTTAARHRTNALSRAYSIFHALQRLGFVAGAGENRELEESSVAAAANHDGHVCVHSVGTDAVEGQTVDETVAVFAPLCTLLRAACPRCRRLTVVLNGMDLIVPKGIVTAQGASSSPSSLCLETVVDGVTLALCWRPGVYSSDLYNALVAERRAPHAVFCFNAGLWGYDTWAKTLEMVLRKGCPGLVVTSYTWQEADDDCDVLQRALDAVTCSGGEAAAQWVWDAERNPFGSTLPRPSYHPGEFLRDNSWWMCAASERQYGQ